jgi:hypothetical protein
MKNNSILLALVVLLALPGTLLAGSREVEPVFTRYARIYQAPTVDLRAGYFRDKPMEEMQGFDGYGVTLDITLPINAMSQIELLAPLYTRGDGKYDNPGDPANGLNLDVEGNGGVREYPSLIYERRFPWLEERLGASVAWLAGAGKRMATLDADYKGTEIDRFNHTGHNFQVGLKADDDIRGGDMTLLGNLRYVMFRDSDDINLSDSGSATFEVLYVTGAVMFNDRGRITPVLEAILEYDFEDYTAFSLAPEMVYSVSDNWDAKLAAPFRLTSDGQKYAAELELTYRF